MALRQYWATEPRQKRIYFRLLGAKEPRHSETIFLKLVTSIVESVCCDAISPAYSTPLSPVSCFGPPPPALVLPGHSPPVCTFNDVPELTQTQVFPMGLHK